MTAPLAEDLINCSQCVALAPLLYVAWADGELDPNEVTAVMAGAQNAPVALSTKQQTALSTWLNPEFPPSATELLRLYRFVRTNLSRLNATERASLVDLGFGLARLHHGKSNEQPGQLALSEIEQVLGLRGSDVVREWFVPRPTVEQHFEESPASFSPAAITTWLDGDYREDWQGVRELLKRETFRNNLSGRSEEDQREIVLEWLRILAAEGLGAVGYPTELGGGGKLDRFVEVFEALGMFDLSLAVKFGVQFGLCGGAILNLGTKQHHAELLPAVGDASLLGGFAMTERGHGSNVRELETIARYDHTRKVFIVHTPSASARKEWIGNAAAHGQTMVVFAQLEVEGEGCGVHALMVPIRGKDNRPLPGVTISDCGHKMGLNGVDNGRLAFDHVEVPRSALLDRYGRVDDEGHYQSDIASEGRRFFTMLGTLVGGRIGVGAAAITASKTVLAIAIRYAALRRQFGPAGKPERRIIDYRTHAQRLFPRVAATYALHCMMTELQAQWRDHEGDDMREIESLAAGVKAVATWHAIDTAQQCRECCGGMGFLSVNRIAQIRKDVDVFATFEGDNVVLLQLVAKGLLTGYARAFQTDLVGTLLRQFGRRASATLLERNPFESRRTGTEHLRDAEFHGQAFAFRAEDLQRSAAARVKKRTDAGMDGFDAVMEVQDHLLLMALAHVEHMIHAAFARAIAKMDPGPERDAMELMRCLYAVWRLNEGCAWFLENGYIEPSKARALRKMFATLCDEVRPMALPLVDAFGIPDEVLAAPIAFEGYAEAESLK